MIERLAVIAIALLSACGAPATTTPVCPDGGNYVVREVCTCGPAGGCASQTLQCVQVCSTSSDCPNGMICGDGVCGNLCF